MAFPVNLESRSLQGELMDDPQLQREPHHQALQGLARINRVCRTTQVIWRSIEKTFQRSPSSPLTVLDIACGGGDLAINLARLAKKASYPLVLKGCDISPQAIEFARKRAVASGTNVEFFVQDVFKFPDTMHADIVYSSLFLHHLTDDAAVQLLTKMSTVARKLVLVQDLVRSRLGYTCAWLGVRLLTRSRICHVDGPLSVRSAFRPSELQELAERSGMPTAKITRHWPQRMLLTWSPDGYNSAPL